LDVVGWYQISGQPTEAQQLPYLASATIPGAALIVAGAVLIAGRRRVDARGDASRAYTALDNKGSGAVRRAGLWALPDGSYLHRGDCPLLDGKPEAFEVTGAEAGHDGGPAAPTRPCPICEPDLVAAP
jgi:hypothetical protein